MLQGGAGGVHGAMSTTDIAWRITSSDVAQPLELLLVEQAAVVLMTSLFVEEAAAMVLMTCLLYTSPSPRDNLPSRMPSSA